MLMDKASLLHEAHQRTGVNALQNNYDTLIAFAEMLLERELIVYEQTQAATLTTVHGVAALPADFIRSDLVLVGNKRQTKVEYSDLVAGGQSNAYCFHGGKIHSTHDSADHILHYFAKLPSLNANASNWLSKERPDVYLSALIFQAYVADNQAEKAAQASALMQSVIQQINRASASIRGGATKIQTRTWR